MISFAIAAKLSNVKPLLQHNFMATCMSMESLPVPKLDEQYFLHLCQSYYVPETRGDNYQVNSASELHYIVSRSWIHDEYVFVFNKHWLHNSRLLEDCSVPLLVAPPPLPADKQLSPRHLWHQHVAEQAVDKYNRAIVAFRDKYLDRCIGKSAEPNTGLILHEIHRNRYNGGWNHAIQLV